MDDCGTNDHHKCDGHIKLHKLLHGVTVREIQTMIGRIFLFVSKTFENSWINVALTVSVKKKSLFR